MGTIQIKKYERTVTIGKGNGNTGRNDVYRLVICLLQKGTLSDDILKKEDVQKHILFILIDKQLSVLEEFLNFLVRNHLLIKNVSTRLWALNHLDNF